MRLGGLSGDAGDFSGDAHIGHMRRCGATGGADLCCHCFGLGQIGAGDHGNLGAFAPEQPCCLFADPLRAAGDQGNLAL